METTRKFKVGDQVCRRTARDGEPGAGEPHGAIMRVLAVSDPPYAWGMVQLADRCWERAEDLCLMTDPMTDALICPVCKLAFTLSEPPQEIRAVDGTVTRKHLGCLDADREPSFDWPPEPRRRNE